MRKTKLAVTVFALVLALTTVSLAQTPTQMPDRTKPLVKLNLTIVGAGTVEPAPKPPTYPKYPLGTKVTLKAKATDGWQFLRYEGAVKSTSPVVTLVMNNNKQVKATFKLLPPTISGQSADQTLAEGDTATLYVQASGACLRYRWMANGSMIPRATCSSLTFAAALSNDGIYACRVSNLAGGMKSNEMILQVVAQLRPQLVAQLIDNGDVSTQITTTGHIWSAGDECLISSPRYPGPNVGHIIDISDPFNPAMDNVVGQSSACANLAVSLGGSVRLTSYNFGGAVLNRIFDFNDPVNPVLLSTIDEGHMEFYDVAVINPATVVIAGGFGAVVYDLTDLSHPNRVFWLFDKADNVYVNSTCYDGKGLLYVGVTDIGTRRNHILTYDISNWMVVSDFDTERHVGKMYTRYDRFLYTNEGDGVGTYTICRDISDPADPVVTHVISGYGVLQDGSSTDDYIMCRLSCSGGGYMSTVELYFLGCDGTFVPVGNYESTAMSYGSAVLLQNDRVYLGGRDGEGNFLLEVISLW